MKRIVLILMCLSPLLGRSQELYVVGFTSMSAPGFNPGTDSVTFFNMSVTNFDSTADFNDNLYIHFAVRDILNQAQPFYAAYTGNQSIPGYDTLVLPYVYVDINTSYFTDGNNTVVIWPACPGIHTYDSLEFDVTYSSVNEWMANEINVTLGPNPASNKLFLGDPDNLVKKVRFRTMEGRLIGVGTTNTLLNLNLSDGIYIVELETVQRIYTRKLIVRK